MNGWLVAGLSSMLALTGYLVGGMLAMAGGRWLHHHLYRLNIFCGGLLIGLLVFEFLPHIFVDSDPVAGGLGMVVGIIALVFLDHVVHDDHGLPTPGNNMQPWRAVFFLCIGLSLHNFPTGMAIGSGFSAHDDFIPHMLLALFVHHIPEGLAISIPLLGKPSIVFPYLGLAAMLSAIVGLGTLAGGYFAGDSFVTQTWLIGMATGTIFYVTFYEILCKTKSYVSPFDFVFYLLVGILLIRTFL